MIYLIKTMIKDRNREHYKMLSISFQTFSEYIFLSEEKGIQIASPIGFSSFCISLQAPSTLVTAILSALFVKIMKGNFALIT